MCETAGARLADESLSLGHKRAYSAFQRYKTITLLHILSELDVSLQQKGQS